MHLTKCVHLTVSCTMQRLQAKWSPNVSMLRTDRKVKRRGWDCTCAYIDQLVNFPIIGWVSTASAVNLAHRSMLADHAYGLTQEFLTGYMLAWQPIACMCLCTNRRNIRSECIHLRVLYIYNNTYLYGRKCCWAHPRKCHVFLMNYSWVNTKTSAGEASTCKHTLV